VTTGNAPHFAKLRATIDSLDWFETLREAQSQLKNYDELLRFLSKANHNLGAQLLAELKKVAADVSFGEDFPETRERLLYLVEALDERLLG
jgi:hypothetical protein